ncbi:MAG: DUF2868 domain-containing protein [Desulfobulbaceae bacterium]|nr:DUF2868 domain-containing protein [Desulfobulbaceae bacterium]
MNTRWNLADLLDLEYLFGRDESIRLHEGEQVLAKRDRIIYLAKIAPKLKDTTNPSSQGLIHRWLKVRQHTPAGDRENGQEILLPGTVWREVSAIFLGFALLFGFASGLGLAGAFLVYSGTAPLNVSAFLGIFVVLQLAILLLQALLLLLRRLKRTQLQSSALYALLLRLMAAGVDWVHTRAHRNLPAEQRLNFAALFGRLRSRRAQAPLFIWPVFFLLQLLAVGFNLGVLGLTLAKVIFSDMAFGWQSSLQLSAAQIAEGVRLVALPWGWILPEGTGFPSLAQIEGTQIILKDGIYHLATQDLVSWWPFLCMALLVYGLLPRVSLLVGGLVQYRRQLERLELRSPETRRLLQRMTTPQMETGGEGVDDAHLRRGVATSLEDSMAVTEEDSVQTGPTVPSIALPVQRLILVPEELFASTDITALQQAVARIAGVGESKVQALPFSASEEQELLTQIHAEYMAQRLDEICILQEAWMPPLEETYNLLRELRRVSGAATPITVVLIGKPQGRERLTPTLPEHAAIWHKKMQALADPSLDTRTLMEVT